MKFLHLSDPHIHGDSENNDGVNQAMKNIKENFPDHIRLWTGDLTDDGSENQYKMIREILAVGEDIICPGNHDFGAAGNFYSRERAERFDLLCRDLKQPGTFAGECLPVVTMFHEERGDIMVICLDSNLETESPFDFACGEVGEKQLRALPSLLNTPAFKIVMLHHHPFMHSDPFMELKDAEQLARVIYGKADLLLFGHKHVMDHWEGRWGIPYILAADALYNADFAREIDIDVGNRHVVIQDVKIH